MWAWMVVRVRPAQGASSLSPYGSWLQLSILLTKAKSLHCFISSLYLCKTTYKYIFLSFKVLSFLSLNYI